MWTKRYRVVAHIPHPIPLTIDSSPLPDPASHWKGVRHSHLEGGLFTRKGLRPRGELRSWIQRRPPPSTATFDSDVEWAKWQRAPTLPSSPNPTFSPPSSTIHALDRRVHPFVPETMLYYSTSEKAIGPSRLAVSAFTLLDVDKERRVGMWEVELKTGRSHQLRIHWADAGCPIVQDPYYNHYYIYDLTRKEREKRGWGGEGDERIRQMVERARVGGEDGSRAKPIVRVRETTAEELQKQEGEQPEVSPEVEAEVEETPDVSMAGVAHMGEEESAGDGVEEEEAEEEEGEEDEEAMEDEEEGDEEMTVESDSKFNEDGRFKQAASSYLSSRSVKSTSSLGPSFYVVGKTSSPGRSFSTGRGRGGRGGGGRRPTRRDDREEEDTVYADVLRKYGVQAHEDREEVDRGLIDEPQSLDSLKEAEEEEEIRELVEARRNRQRERGEERLQRRRDNQSPRRRGWEEMDPSAAIPTADEVALHPTPQSESPSSTAPSATARRARRREPVGSRVTAAAGWLVASAPENAQTVFSTTAHDMALQAYELTLPHPTSKGKMLTLTLPLVEGWGASERWPQANAQWQSFTRGKKT